MTELSEYKDWLIEQMQMKIKAAKIIRSWNTIRPIKTDGFIEALEVMIAFVQQITPESLKEEEDHSDEIAHRDHVIREHHRENLQQQRDREEEGMYDKAERIDDPASWSEQEEVEK